MGYKANIKQEEIFFDNQLVEAKEGLDLYYAIKIDSDGPHIVPAGPYRVIVDILDERAHEDYSISGDEFDLDGYHTEVVIDQDNFDLRENFTITKMFVKTGSQEIFLEVRNV